MRNRNLAGNAILNTIKTILGIIFPLITFPYVSRVLGVGKIGIYEFSVSYISYFLLIAGLGISTYGIREGTQYRDDRQKINKFVSEVFSINLISTLVAYILLGLTLILFERLEHYRLAICILSIELLFTTIGVSWICNIYEDFLFITIRSLLIQIVSLALIFIFIRGEQDLYKYICIVVIANTGSNVINFFYIRKYCRFHFTLKIDWKKRLRPIMTIFSTTIAITIYVSSDSTMLGFMTNDTQVGLYGTAVKVYTLLKNVLSALTLVLIPRFSLLLGKKDYKVADSLFSRVFNILTVVMVPMVVGLFMLSEDVTLLLFGPQYYESAGVLRLLSIAVLFSLYAYLYTQCILIPVKQETIVFKATLLSAVINIVLNIFMIPLWGIYAAAVTTLIAEGCTFIIVFICSQKYIHFPDIKKNIVGVFGGSAGIIVCCLLSRKCEIIPIRVLFSMVLSLIAYALVNFLLKNEIFLLFAEQIKKKK